MKKSKNETVQEFAHRVLLNCIAENRGYRYDNKKGLSDLKTGSFVTNDKNVIAKTLLGQMTTEKDLATMESILSVITKLYNYDKLVEAAKPILKEQGIDLPETQMVKSSQTGTVDWFRKMISMCNENS